MATSIITHVPLVLQLKPGFLVPIIGARSSPGLLLLQVVSHLVTLSSPDAFVADLLADTLAATVTGPATCIAPGGLSQSSFSSVGGFVHAGLVNDRHFLFLASQAGVARGPVFKAGVHLFVAPFAFLEQSGSHLDLFVSGVNHYGHVQYKQQMITIIIPRSN